MLLRKSLALLLAAAVLLLAGCTAAPVAPAAPPADAGAGTTAAPAAEGEPVKGGTVIVGSPQEPGMLNPLLASASIEDAVNSL